MFIAYLFIVNLLLCSSRGEVYEDVINRGINLKDLCEECDTSTGSGYSLHPRYCHLFIHCSMGGEGKLTGQVKECPRGLLWSQRVKQCVWPRDSDCSNNPCINRSSTLRDVRNCNGYFSCPNGNYMQYHCCPQYQRHDESTGKCIHDFACFHACLPGSANVTALPPGCDKFEVPNDPSKYLWSVNGQNVTMTCATGTAFSMDFCSCTKTADIVTNVDRCDPYIYFPFDADIKDANGKSAAGGNVDIRRNEPSTVGGGTAYFQGSQQIVAWAMNNMEFRSNFTLSFRFKPLLPDSQASGDARYALVDNSDCEKEATFGVALLRTSFKHGTIHGGFRLKNGMAFTASSGDMLLTQWHDVVLLKEGSRAELRLDGKVHPIEGQVAMTDVEARMYHIQQRGPDSKHENSLGIEADIDRVDCSMTIGTGTGLQNFIGYIDEVKYYRCVPKEYQ